MNIFYIDQSPIKCAQQMVDKHVVKMILETAQLLSTAHRVLDGVEYEGQSRSGRKAKRWQLDDIREHVLYQATHINHPSAVWCRASNNNYNWLFAHFMALLDEYKYRYGKNHACQKMVGPLSYAPLAIPVTHFTPVTPAMPDEYIVEHDSVASYQKYYRFGKTHLHKWTKRNPPEWLLA